MIALHHGDGKGTGSLTEGLTKNVNLVLAESLKELPDLLGGINTHLNVSYQHRGMKIFCMKLNHSV